MKIPCDYKLTLIALISLTIKTCYCCKYDDCFYEL